MAGPEQESLHRKALLAQWIIWASMTMTVAIYVWVGFLVRAQGVAVEIASGQLAMVKLVGWFVAPIMLVAACRVRAFMMARYRKDGHEKNNEIIGQAKAPVYVARAHTAMVFSLALSEIPVVYGFVLFLLGESRQLLIFYAAVSLAANILNRPKRSELEALADAGPGLASPIYTTKEPF